MLLMISALLRGEGAKEVFRRGIIYFSLLLSSVGVYYLVTLAVCKLTGIELLTYAFNENSLLFRVLIAYSSFLGTLLKGYFGYVNGTACVVAHLVILLVVAALVIAYIARKKDVSAGALLALCIALLPLSINSIYLIAQTGIISSWTQYPFVCIYIAAAVIVDLLCENVKLRDVVTIALTVILISNIYLANKVYLKVFFDYENAYAFYTVLVSDIKKSPDYDDGMQVYIAGTADGLRSDEKFDIGQVNTFLADPVNFYSKDTFVNYYIGSDISMVGSTEYALIRQLTENDDYDSMPAYPAEGSIREIDGYLVVKLG